MHSPSQGVMYKYTHTFTLRGELYLLIFFFFFSVTDTMEPQMDSVAMPKDSMTDCLYKCGNRKCEPWHIMDLFCVFCLAYESTGTLLHHELLGRK